MASHPLPTARPAVCRHMEAAEVDDRHLSGVHTCSRPLDSTGQHLGQHSCWCGTQFVCSPGWEDRTRTLIAYHQQRSATLHQVLAEDRQARALRGR